MAHRVSLLWVGCHKTMTTKKSNWTIQTLLLALNNECKPGIFHSSKAKDFCKTLNQSRSWTKSKTNHQVAKILPVHNLLKCV